MLNDKMEIAKLLFLSLFLLSPVSTVFSATAPPSPRIKAVNLGGWLVTEGWIKPSLFDKIVNNDLLDGTQIQLKSVFLGKYLVAENGGGSVIAANRTTASGWETFRLWRVDSSRFQLRVFSKQFIGVDVSGRATAAALAPGPGEIFEIVRNPAGGKIVRLRAANGQFLQAKTGDSVTADSAGNGSFGSDDPSAFLMTVVGTMQGEFQVTNGYGPLAAPAVMREHWASFIVESDFKFIRDKGLNAVRIPVGWWIASDPTPPPPYVGGSLAALDNAFSWADKYGLKIIIDLHAAPGSQNGYEHSGGRDGSIEWGSGDTVAQTVAVIEFLSRRYANRPSLIAVELINEPRAEGVSAATLKNYYQLGYDAVRKYTSTAYVIFSARLSADQTEFVSFASGLSRTVIDVHYYNLFTSSFNGLTAQQNIDFVKSERARQLAAVTPTNGQPLSFIGEWVAEWNVPNASKDDYMRFAQAQLDVFGNATFGWAYWTYRNVNKHWSLEWMINNGYITLI